MSDINNFISIFNNYKNLSLAPGESNMIIFTHIPKTAGTTLKYILRNNFGTRHIDSAKVKRDIFSYEDLRFARKIFNKPLALSGHNLIDPASNIKEPGAQIITVLRDPLTRCASHYQDEVNRGKLELSFENWITMEENQNLSVKIIAGRDDLNKAKKLLKETYCWVGITEHFNDSMKLLKMIIDHPLDMQYRRMITASSNEIKDHLLSDKSSLELLKKHNSLDQQLYDFAVKEIFQQQVEDNRVQLDSMILPKEIYSKRKDFKYKRSVGYNKYIYRQLIKLLGK